VPQVACWFALPRLVGYVQSIAFLNIMRNFAVHSRQHP
jgi:hypothetical protein